MKKTLPTLLLFLGIFITVQSKAQSDKIFQRLYSASNTQPTKNTALPTNRTAFIFENSDKSYTNPALALLDAKHKNTETQHTTTTVESTIENKQENQNNVQMFSNQTEDELWIQLNKEVKTQNNLNLEIYNQEGERIYNSLVADNLHKINVCDFTTGTFLIKLGDTVQKMIIE